MGTKESPRVKTPKASSLIGEFIRAKRTERGLTQTQLAEHAEVSFTFVNRVENGDLKVQLGTLNKILSVFGWEIGPIKIVPPDPQHPQD